MKTSAYGWLMLTGIIASIFFWSRLARRDDRLLLVYVAALLGAFFGAKVVYLLAEGWIDWPQPDRWRRLLTGKTIIGGLLGGYASVEIAKRLVGYRSATGDWFALIVPVGILFGRAGCWLHGCCLGHVCASSWYTLKDSAGIDRWPAVPVEILFNLLALGAALLLRWGKVLPGQHFHLYLIAYGVFRFAHEFFRDTPRVLGPMSGYAIAALATAGLGLAGFMVRRRAPGPPLAA